MTGACMLILLAWSAGIPHQIKPPRDIFPVCGQCETDAERWDRGETPDPLPGVKTVRLTSYCLGAPTEPEPAPPAEAKKEAEPQTKWWGRR